MKELSVITFIISSLFLAYLITIYAMHYFNEILIGKLTRER